MPNAVAVDTGLVSSLLLLSGDRVTPGERNAAAKRLFTNVQAWAGGYLRRASPCRLDDDDVHEAVQHLMMRCTTGTSRFRGTTEGEAHSWCMKVFQNKARDLCRLRWRLARTDSESEVEQPVSQRLEMLAASEIGRVVDAVEQELPRLHRAQDIEGLIRSLRCHLDARLGATIEEQMDLFGFAPGTSGTRTAAETTKARNRVYQYRKRGRAAGCEALAALVAQGRFTSTDVTDVYRLLGCDAAGDVHREKKLLS